ncbi:hypothetical protein BN2497_10815 [Janthinobacterium sp. CG23_2]|nr:hypothetical protein BN2497_10815 [Janthinobacterium sp. CG23_2]CUU31805.1 hypothetical protein BN3177_10815 [Janthinobacterium sp. CG23_2]
MYTVNKNFLFVSNFPLFFAIDVQTSNNKLNFSALPGI